VPPAGPTALAPAAGDDGEVAASAKVNQRWTFQDRCNDRRGIRARLFDKTNRTTKWPASGYYRISSLSQATKTISCDSGHKICFGAVQDPPVGSGHWGVGINGNFGCSACCTLCRATALRVTLSCGRGFSDSGDDIEFDGGEALSSE
jgi:hypothetical protein